MVFIYIVIYKEEDNSQKTFNDKNQASSQKFRQLK